MKILGFNIGGSKQAPQPEPEKTTTRLESGMDAFSTPFMKIGKGNLSLPFVSNRWRGSGGYIPFSTDNLFPSLLEQLVLSSPMHSQCVHYKHSALIGGGYELKPMSDTAKAKVDIYAFESKYQFNKLLSQFTFDWIKHERMYVLLTVNNEGKVTNFERVWSSKVRVDDKGKFFVSDDWSTNYQISVFPKYHPACREKYQMFEYKLQFDYDYPFPQYQSANNHISMDGEQPLLLRSNIINAIYPSMAITFLGKYTDEDKDKNKASISRNSGPLEAGHIMAFYVPTKENAPVVQPIPQNPNDKLFEGSDKFLDTKICQAHGIEAALMNVATAGQLGNNQQQEFAYVNFEKTYVMKTRAILEDFISELLSIVKLDATFKINDFKIVEKQIIEQTKTTN